MHLDVENLNNFYSQTLIGQFTRRQLQDSVKKLWGTTFTGQIAGYGFSSPIVVYWLKKLVGQLPQVQSIDWLYYMV